MVGSGHYMLLPSSARGSSGVGSSWSYFNYTITTLGAHKIRWIYHKDGEGSDGDDCGWVDSVHWTPAARTPSTSLADALDTSLDVVTSGDQDWYRTTYPYYHGGDSAESGDISDNQVSQMEVWVEGPGSGSFYWKVSSEEDYDWLEFYVDGVLKGRISGEVDWTQKTYTVTGSGTHSLLWQYIKDSSGSEGDDSGWVDWL